MGQGSCTCQVGPDVETRSRRSVAHACRPSATHRRAVVILPQDVGLAVGVEIAAAAACQFGPDWRARVRSRARWCRSSATQPRASLFCHRMSALPSPLKSAASLTCQAGRIGEGGSGREHAGPSIRPTAGVPSAFCHRMSALPSPLSRGGLLVQVGPVWMERGSGREHAGPFISHTAGVAVVVLPQDVGLAVAVEIAGIFRCPARARIGSSGPIALRFTRPSAIRLACHHCFCKRMSDLPSALKSWPFGCSTTVG